MGNSVQIGIPFSANEMYTPIGWGKLIKSKKYREWIAKNQPILAESLTPAEKFPIVIDILVMGGRGFTSESDIDNVCKPIADLLKRAGTIPDDKSQYVESIKARYLYGGRGSEAITMIRYEEPDEIIETLDFTQSYQGHKDQ